MHWTRRSLLQAAAVGAGGLLLPHRLYAGSGASDRKFLFVFATGGWDQCYCFAPLFDSEAIEMENDAAAATVNGITFVEAPSRPNVRSFFEDWGDKTALINGLEARSVAHDVCLRLVMTGTQQPSADDWSATIAAYASGDPLMPMIHRSGPSYTYRHGSSVVRVGSANQLPNLLDGSALQASDQGVVLPASDLESLQDAYAHEIATRREAAAARGRALALMSQARTAEERLAALARLSSELDLNLGGGSDLGTMLGSMLDIFEQDLARTALVGHTGFMGLGWDTHANAALQGDNFDELFGVLSDVMTELHERPGPSGGTLADITTVVVLSEMGRYPQLNSRQGKEHWTFTSAMIIGAGVRGGQTIGGYDEFCTGQPVELNSGEIREDGVLLLPNHLGSTLLRIAGLDDQEFQPGFGAIEAILSDS
jgi:uncharacterized protein (DUF1501 family)